MYILRVGDGVVSWPESREQVKHKACEAELHQHMHRCREQRKFKIQMLGIEHPFVVLENGQTWWRVKERHVPKILTEKRYTTTL